MQNDKPENKKKKKAKKFNQVFERDCFFLILVFFSFRFLSLLFAPVIKLDVVGQGEATNRKKEKQCNKQPKKVTNKNHVTLKYNNVERKKFEK